MQVPEKTERFLNVSCSSCGSLFLLNVDNMPKELQCEKCGAVNAVSEKVAIDAALFRAISQNIA